MAGHPIEARRRAEWERIRGGGLARFLLVRGVLWRGLPMALAVVLLLELARGEASEGIAWRDPLFLGRFVLAAALFSLGGIFSSYARWKALDARFGEAAGRPGGR